MLGSVRDSFQWWMPSFQDRQEVQAVVAVAVVGPFQGKSDQGSSVPPWASADDSRILVFVSVSSDLRRVSRVLESSVVRSVDSQL